MAYSGLERRRKGDKANGVKLTYQEGVSLKEFLLVKLESQEQALKLARETLEKRLEGMNAFREQINRIEGTLVTRNELDLILDRIDKDKRADIAVGLAVLALIANMVMYLIK